MAKRPTFYVVAGPNGSGKSSIISNTELALLDIPYLCADGVARSLVGDYPDRKARDEAAWGKCNTIREEFIEAGNSFIWETVCSHESRVEIMARAKDLGFEVSLIFVTTRSVEINVERVRQRVLEGGHPVSEDLIRSRYPRTMALLPRLLRVSDRVRAYDNSVFGERPDPVLMLLDSRLTLFADPPLWAEELFSKMEEESRAGISPHYEFIRDGKKEL